MTQSDARAQTSSLVIKIDGAMLPDAVFADVFDVTIEQDLVLPDTFAMRIFDIDTQLQSGSQKLFPLADGWPELLDMLAPALEHVDYLFPNEEQAIALTGASGWDTGWVQSDDPTGGVAYGGGALRPWSSLAGARVCGPGHASTRQEPSPGTPGPPGRLTGGRRCCVASGR